MHEPHLELYETVERMAAVVEQEARRSGTEREEAAREVRAGLRYCSACAAWHTISRFGRDTTRLEGIATQCRLAVQYAKRLRRCKPLIKWGM